MVTDLGPTSHAFISQRLRLNYVDWGNHDAPLLLLIHGARDHSRSWDWTARALRQDWHVVAPDLRGHGDSAWSPEGRYEFAGWIYDLAQLAEHLGSSRMTIIGHSLGAHIALRYAGLYPERVAGLFAVEPTGAPLKIEAERDTPSIDVRMRRWIEEKREAAAHLPRRYPTIEAALERMRAENANLTEAQARHLTEHGAARNEDGSWSWKFDNHVRVWPFPDVCEQDVLALWGGVTCPVALLYGKQSWPSSLPAKLEQMLPHAWIEKLDGAGHWPHHDRFDQFLAAVRSFLDGQRGLPSTACGSSG